MVILALAMLGASPAMPDAFLRLPPEVRNKATVVVSGRYRTGRGPCELLPDGSSRWPLLRGFAPVTLYRGQVRTDYIGVESPRLFGAKDDDPPLVEDREYLLVLRPSKAAKARMQKREGSRHYRDALAAEEVLAIVEH